MSSRRPSYDISKKISSSQQLTQPGASMKAVVTGSGQKKRKYVPSGPKPMDSTRAAQPKREPRQSDGRSDGNVQRARSIKSTFRRPKLQTKTVGSVSPSPAARRKSQTPALWHHGKGADTASALAEVANTEDPEECDTSYDAAPATVRQSNPDNFSPAHRAHNRPPRGSGGRWSTERGDRLCVATEAREESRVDDPTRQRVTRSQARGDAAVMWGNKHSKSTSTRCRSATNSRDSAYRPRYTPVEDSPSTKRAKEKQAELKKQGNQMDEAITLSSDDEPEEEGGDEAGVISFQLDDEKVFFGAEAKSAAKKISFSDKGLQIPAQDVWGDGKDADIVPYEQIERITYDAGKHLFLSVVLESESPKLQTVVKTIPGMRKRKFHGEHLQRILLPLRSSQTDVFAERRKRIEDEFISQALVSHSDTFFVQALAHQVQDLLFQTPYQVRRFTRSASAVSSACDSDTLMVYYPNHGKSRVKITKADYNVLGEHEMLNDSAIDFYLKWIEHEVVVKCSTVANQFLFFGTFFFKKMTTQIKAKLRGPTARLDRLASVEKYNSRGGESIWNRRFLIIPINEAYHWSLAIACIGPPHGQDEHLQAPESTGPRPRRVDLLYFDSLGHRGRKHCKEIVEYLNYKWNKEYNMGKDDSNASVDHPYKMIPAAAARRDGSSYTCDGEDGISYVNLVQKNVPNQENGHDCGVFLLEYAERFAKDVIYQAAQGSDCSEYIKRSDFHEWFQPETVKNKRTHMQQLLQHLEKQRIAFETQAAKAACTKKADKSDKQNSQTGKENIADGNANEDAEPGADKGLLPGHAGQDHHPPRQQLEVWIALKKQGQRSKFRDKSFVVPENQIDSVQGTINLLQRFKEWFEKDSAEDIGEVQNLKLHRRCAAWTACRNEFELSLDKTPEQNFLSFGDNLYVQSSFYDLHKAQARESAEMIDDDDSHDEAVQTVDSSKTRPWCNHREATGPTDASKSQMDHKPPVKVGCVATARIPRKTSKNNRCAPPENQKLHESIVPQPADPAWVEEQTDARRRTLSKSDTRESDSEASNAILATASEADNSGTQDGKIAYGKRPRKDTRYKVYGESEGQRISGERNKKQRIPPPLPALPGSAGHKMMLRRAGSASHLN